MKFVHFCRSFASRQKWKNAPKMPEDTKIAIKTKPEQAPELSFESTESVYQQVLTQPRSYLKLPVYELIKSFRASRTPASSESADTKLALLRTKPDSLIVRSETFLPILDEYALAGQYEKAESVVLNLKQDFGVEPSVECMSALALAYYNGNRRGSALKVLDMLPSWNVTAQTIYKAQISEALKAGDGKKAENLYLKVQQKCKPSPELTGMLLMSYGKTGFIEKGLLMYEKVIASGMEPNPVTHAAMIYLCTREKRTFKRALHFYDQMKLLKFPIHLRVHNYMLQGCSKVADLSTSIAIWNELNESCKLDSRLQPNEFTLSSVLWNFASIETAETQLSKRDFHYEMPVTDLVATATQIYRSGEQMMPVNSHIANAYLAVLTNNLQTSAAESFFHSEMVDQKRRTEHSYELMFKMYDSLRDLPKTLQLKEKMHSEGLVVPFEGWRAMIRTAALNNNVSLSISMLEEMVAIGYKPSIEDLKVVKLRLFELRKLSLKPKLEALCLQPDSVPKDDHDAWRQRSLSLQALFDQIYGRFGPKSATDANK